MFIIFVQNIISTKYNCNEIFSAFPKLQTAITLITFRELLKKLFQPYHDFVLAFDNHVICCALLNSQSKERARWMASKLPESYTTRRVVLYSWRIWFRISGTAVALWLCCIQVGYGVCSHANPNVCMGIVCWDDAISGMPFYFPYFLGLFMRDIFLVAKCFLCVWTLDARQKLGSSASTSD